MVTFRLPHAMVVGLMSLATAVLAHDDAAAESVAPRKRVLELFTSQGCSSCPPADALLETYKSRGDVIALSLPVDYWDRLGWKDTFGSRNNSNRQRAYAVSRGDGQVYTPQIVVDGRAHVIGSVASSIDHVMGRTRPSVEASHVALNASVENDAVVIAVGAAQTAVAGPAANVVLAAVQDRGTVAIGRGENAGRTITYHNIVRSMRTVGAWHGSSARLRVPLTDVERSCCSSVVVLVQQGTSGPILAAEQARIR